MFDRGMYLSLIAAAFMNEDSLNSLARREEVNPKFYKGKPESKPGIRSQERKDKRKAARKKSINNRKRRGYK